MEKDNMVPEGYESQIEQLKALGFKHYSSKTSYKNDYFEHPNRIFVRYRSYCWMAYCSHVHNEEYEEGEEGFSPIEALLNLINSLDYFDQFAKEIENTAIALKEMKIALNKEG